MATEYNGKERRSSDRTGRRNGDGTCVLHETIHGPHGYNTKCFEVIKETVNINQAKMESFVADIYKEITHRFEKMSAEIDRKLSFKVSKGVISAMQWGIGALMSLSFLSATIYLALLGGQIKDAQITSKQTQTQVVAIGVAVGNIERLGGETNKKLEAVIRIQEKVTEKVGIEDRVR